MFLKKENSARDVILEKTPAKRPLALLLENANKWAWTGTRTRMLRSTVHTKGFIAEAR